MAHIFLILADKDLCRGVILPITHGVGGRGCETQTRGRREMASIYIYNLKGGKCVELNSPQIVEEDIAQLKSLLPPNLEGLSFESPLSLFDSDTPTELKVESQEPRVAEYLKGIGTKLQKLRQIPGALRFYDLAYRVSGNTDMLMVKAQALSQTGQVERADQLLQRFSEARPDHPEPYFYFGKNALSRNDYNEALRHFETSLDLIRVNNVEHRGLRDLLNYYIRFTDLYLDRDQLFNRDLDDEAMTREILQLRQRTQTLAEEIERQHKSELEGMMFYLRTQEEVFGRWLEEIAKRSPSLA